MRWVDGRNRQLEGARGDMMVVGQLQGGKESRKEAAQGLVKRGVSQSRDQISESY